MIPVVLVPSYLASQQIAGKAAEWKVRVPPIPTAFTGRGKEIQCIVDFVSKEHVNIVSITGGPAYGKSSLAIVCSHRLMEIGIRVYHISLSEVNTIETFIMAFMRATVARKTEEIMSKHELLLWVSLLKTSTVIVLDNVDHLTLNEIIRDEFLVLLKEVVAASGYVHLLVTTRYRFQIADGFEEIHVQPLESAEAINLLEDIIRVANGANVDESVNIKDIVSKTGGIPLAIKVVGRLLKSKDVSSSEIIEKLSVNPLHALSKETFTPDEQLKRCFDLSFRYLKSHEQQCFLYVSQFPGSFDHKARDAIITTTTGDANCLEHLVDRSLLEYNYIAKRYTMHSLLRVFGKDSMPKRREKRRYFWLYAKHYMDLLSNCIIEARAGDNVSAVYTIIEEDHHNFLHVLQLYVNGTFDHSVRHVDVLIFALDTFDIMQPRFPKDALADWWMKILNNTCSIARHDLNSFEVLMPQFVELTTKFGKLLLHYNNTQFAKRILLFSERCVKSVIIQPWMDRCLHPHYSLYTAILQVLKSVYERNGESHRVPSLRTQIYSCISSQSWNYPDSTTPDDVCSDGIDYLKQQVNDDPGDFQSALMLFDVLFKCNMLQAATVELQWLESACHKYQLNTQHEFERIKATVAVAKRFQFVLDHRKEAEWLTNAAEIVADKLTLFNLHFKLTRLHWQMLHNQEEALKHGKTAYDLAMELQNQMQYSDVAHNVVFEAAVRLADILHQIDGRHLDARQYFQEALDRLPFVKTKNAEFTFEQQDFILSHLMSIDYQSSQYTTMFKHYGQWGELEMSRTILNVRKLLDLSYRPQTSSGTSIANLDDSLDINLGIGRTARQFLNVCVKRASFYFDRLIFFIFVCITIAVLLVKACFLCIPMYCTTATLLSLMFTILGYPVLLPLYCIHYFLFYTFTEHKPWIPCQFPIIPKPITTAFWVLSKVVLLFIFVIVWLLCLSGLIHWEVHSPFITSPAKQYHNMSMNIHDDRIYNSYL